MEERVQERYKRYRALTTIKTQKEYEEAKERLNYYMREYTWMQETKEPIKDVKKELEKLLPMLNGEKTESQRYYLRCINLLNAKERRIKDGSYLPSLKQNITALLITTRQYEQNQKEYTLKEILTGIIKRDENILSALKLDRIFSTIMTFGKVQAEEDLSLQRSEDILQYIGKYCNLVGIEMPDYKQNLALVPVGKEHGITPYQDFVSQMFRDYINDSTPKQEIGNQDSREPNKTEQQEHSTLENSKDNTQRKSIDKEKDNPKISQEGEIEK